MHIDNVESAKLLRVLHGRSFATKRVQSPAIPCLLGRDRYSKESCLKWQIKPCVRLKINLVCCGLHKKMTHPPLAGSRQYLLSCAVAVTLQLAFDEVAEFLAKAGLEMYIKEFEER
eukprot:4566626-Amphidinium_carterae.1